jgi:hypothetical protein
MAQARKLRIRLPSLGEAPVMGCRIRLEVNPRDDLSWTLSNFERSRCIKSGISQVIEQFGLHFSKVILFL